MNILIVYFLSQVLGLYTTILAVEYLIVPGSKYLAPRPSKFLDGQGVVRKEGSRYKKAS